MRSKERRCETLDWQRCEGQKGPEGRGEKDSSWTLRSVRTKAEDAACIDDPVPESAHDSHLASWRTSGRIAKCQCQRGFGWLLLARRENRSEGWRLVCRQALPLARERSICHSSSRPFLLPFHSASVILFHARTRAGSARRVSNDATRSSLFIGVPDVSLGTRIFTTFRTPTCATFRLNLPHLSMRCAARRKICALPFCTR